MPVINPVQSNFFSFSTLAIPRLQFALIKCRQKNNTRPITSKSCGALDPSSDKAKSVRGGAWLTPSVHVAKLGVLLNRYFDKPSLKTAPFDVLVSHLLDSFVSSPSAEL